MLSVKLVVVGGEAKSKEMKLRLPTVIGRGREGVSLTLPHPLVSRKHTELFEEEGKLFVRDMGSLNGTFVNNRRIVDQTPLEPNELLTLGNVTFRAIYNLGGAKHSADDSPNEASVDVLEDCEAQSDASDTNKSVVAVEVEETAAAAIDKIATPIEPVAAKASKGLSTGKENEKLDFSFQLEGSADPEAVKNIEINLDETGPAPVTGDSRLGSFLKKMPR